LKQGVALTRRNTTGPPCSVGRPSPLARPPSTHPAAGQPDRRQCSSAPSWPTGSVTDDDRRQPAKQYWPVRRASN